MLPFLRRLKEALEPFVWLITLLGSIATALVTSIVFVHNYYESYVTNEEARIKKDIIDVLTPQYDAKIKAITELTQTAQSAETIDFGRIQREIFDEIDSCYYFTKNFSFAPSPQVQQPQEQMEQFFYLAKDDRVILYLWSYDTNVRYKIRFDGGDMKGLQDLKATKWENIDVTEAVNSSKLDFERFPGINENIHEITVTAELKPPKVKVSVSDPINVDVYGLLVVKRSPLK